jgi:Tfp pilus assembly protein PilV
MAVAVVGIAGTLAASYQQDTVRGNTTTALNLAQQLMEEIAAKPIELASGVTNKPGWSSGQTDRRLYDTIDDYNGYTDFSGSIQTASGTTLNLSDGGSYERSVTVTSNALPSGLTGPSSDFVLVTVTVTMPHNQSTSVSQVFTRVTYYR